jgi:hypothetical protein
MNLTKNAAICDLTPSEFYLSQNYPNPFSDKTSIKFCMAYKAKVRIEVFNSSGELMEKLLDEEREEGTYEVILNTEIFPGGVYFYKMQVGSFTDIKKFILLR